MSDVGMDEDKVSEAYVYARHQAFAFILFGIAAVVGSILFYFLDPQTTEAKWFWVFTGPALGLLVMLRSQGQWQGKTETVPGPYLGVFIGAVAGCFVLSMAVKQSWMVPASLLVVAILLAFLAWFEQNGLGMAAATVVAILTAVTSASSLLADASTVTALLGVFMLFGGLSLAGGQSAPVTAEYRPQLKLVELKTGSSSQADSHAVGPNSPTMEVPLLELALEA